MMKITDQAKAQQIVLNAFLALFVLLWTSLGTMAPSIAAEPAPPVNMIVFDSSGSMWGKFGNTRLAKFLAARETLTNAFATLPTQTRLGLVTFGRSCSGAGVVVPPEAGTQTQILNRIKNLNPKSKGPISLALQKTAEALPPDSQGTLVLIHDGPDNCRQDPCLAAKNFAALHPRMRINLVGLAVTPQAVQQLQCVAKETGGKYFVANSAAALENAITQAFKAAKETPATTDVAGKTPTEEKSESTDDGPPGLQLSVSLAPDGPALKRPVLWIVTQKGEETQKNNVVVAVETANFVRRLKPGNYQVSASVGLARAKDTVVVREQGTTAAKLSLNAGELAFEAPADGTSGFVTVKPAGQGTQQSWLGRSTSPSLIAPEGSYTVIYENGLLRSVRKANVVRGKSATVKVANRSGILQLAAQTPAGATLKDISFHIRVDDPSATGGSRNVLRTRAPTPDVRVPAGTYVVTAKTPHASQSKRIVVSSGDALTETFVFNLGRLALRAELIGSAAQSDLPLLFRVEGLADRAPKEIARSSKRRPSFELPRGTYRVTVELGSGNVKATQTIKLEADEDKDVGLRLDAGELTLARADRSTTRDILWEVIDSKGRIVWRTNQRRPSTLLAPGNYTVRSEASLGARERSLRVSSGQAQVVEVE